MLRLTGLLPLLLCAQLCQAQSVDLLTGNLQYGIPLGAVSANDISIPIGISQHGNALTVAEGEGDCGMGWSLSAGGSITRVVRGLPDELNSGTRLGWLNLGAKYSAIQGFSPAGDDTLGSCSDEATDFTFMDELAYTYDTEPDLFYFQAPGIGGQFILNSSGEPQLLSLQDIKISTFRADSFSIKTNLGMVYSFSSVESVTRVAGGNYCDFTDFQYNASNSIYFTSRWLLTRIQSTATGTMALFTYTTLPQVAYHTFKADSLYFLRDQLQPKRISTIELKTFKAEFTWANNVITKVKFLETVSGNATAKTFELYYKTFNDTTYNATTYKFPVAKTFLYKLREVGPSCSPYASYEFTYAKVDWSRGALAKPWKTNLRQDWFGYLNGKYANKNIPTVFFYDGESDARRTRVTPIPGGDPDQSTAYHDRSVSDSAKFGSLTKVVTPAGGVIDITWEPNVYYDSATFQNLKGGGVRVKSISMNGSDVAYGKPTDSYSPYRAVSRTYEYLASNDSSSGKLLAPLKFGYYTHDGRGVSTTNRGDPSEIMYSRVREIVDTLGSTVYEFSIPGVFPQTAKYEWKATWSRIARKSGTDCGCGNYRNGYFAYPLPPSTNFGHRRGFLKAVYQYANDGTTLVRKREMTALQLPSTPPAAVKAIRYEKIGTSRFYYGVYEILTNRAQVIGAEKVTEYPESGSTPIVTSTKYTYHSTHHMLLTVTDTLADGSTRVKNMKYVKELPVDSSPSQTAAVALKTLNDTNRHGELIEQTTYVTVAGGSPVLTDASLVSYKTFSNGKTLPAYILSVPRGVSVAAASTSGSSLTTDSDYDTVRIFNDYDSEGRPLWESDEKQNKVAHSYSTAYGFEAATFANVPSGYAVYEGFETATTAGMALTGGTVADSAGWTGEKGIPMAYGLTLTSGTITKGSTVLYRLSCWAKASSATKVYFKAQASSLTSIDSLSINNANTWQYYEKIVSASSVPSSFALKITVGNNVTLDDILFAPAEARVALQTAKPMVGVTSATDDRGNSVTFSYDSRGRRVGTFDRKRNLVQKTEYASQKTLGQELYAGFTSNVSEYKVGTSTTFTALEYCNPGAPPSYVWTVDGTQESTSSSLTKTFTIPGRHNVTLTVSKSGLDTKTFTQDICFNLAGTPSITAEDNQSNPYLDGFTADCNTPTLTYTANNIPTGISGCTTTITWRVVNYIWVTDHYEEHVVTVLGTGTSVSYGGVSAGTIKALVQIECSSGADLSCFGGNTFFTLGFNVNWDDTECN